MIDQHDRERTAQGTAGNLLNLLENATLSAQLLWQRLDDGDFTEDHEDISMLEGQMQQALRYVHRAQHLIQDRNRLERDRQGRSI